MVNDHILKTILNEARFQVRFEYNNYTGNEFDLCKLNTDQTNIIVMITNY